MVKFLAVIHTYNDFQLNISHFRRMTLCCLGMKNWVRLGEKGKSLGGTEAPVLLLCLSPKCREPGEAFPRTCHSYYSASQTRQSHYPLSIKLVAFTGNWVMCASLHKCIHHACWSIAFHFWLNWAERVKSGHYQQILFCIRYALLL